MGTHTIKVWRGSVHHFSVLFWVLFVKPGEHSVVNNFRNEFYISHQELIPGLSAWAHSGSCSACVTTTASGRFSPHPFPPPLPGLQATSTPGIRQERSLLGIRYDWQKDSMPLTPNYRLAKDCDLAQVCCAKKGQSGSIYRIHNVLRYTVKLQASWPLSWVMIYPHYHL